MTFTSRATIVGTGLIGASVGLALRQRGWHVSGTDTAPGMAARAIAVGACDVEGLDADSELVVVATPVGTIVDTVHDVLERCPHALVIDVGGVKAPIVSRIDAPRFVGGHPMAGSEAIGPEGADAQLFDGAVWALCPGPSTSDDAYSRVRRIVASFGAQVLTLSPSDHDRLVAVVSHVPHLTAAALVRVARARSGEHAALLRLAAGGFRDMTRIAAGSPAIWPAVCAENREAVLDTLDRLVDELSSLRRIVAESDADGLLDVLSQAQETRRSLPTAAHGPAGDLREVRVFVENRPGSIAAVATLATELDVNLASVSTVDLVDATTGIMGVQVATDDVQRLRDGLTGAGYRVMPAEDDLG